MRRASIAAAALLLVFFVLASANRIDLFFGGVDVGRHVMNGNLLLSSSAPAGTAYKILHRNFYSYAAGDTEFINHHWLSGVVYFLVWKLAGFAGLNVFYVLLGAAALLLNWRIAEKAAGWAFATGLALLTMPILAVRANVRPEIFTLVFIAFFLTLLWKHYNGEVGWGALLALPAVEIFWVNFHIGFIFGPVFIGAFMLGDLEKRRRLRQWVKILGLTLAATLLNPNGIRGALYPLTIWENYGIDITENHSILYLESNGYKGEYLEIKFALVVLYVSFLAAVFFARRFPIPMFLLGVLIGGMGFFAIRNQTVTAMFVLPAVGINAGLCGLKEFSARHRRAMGAALGAILLAGAGFNGWRIFKNRGNVGFGLEPGSDAAADFLRKNHFAGPMLNNLNIGGYLTYYLYPQYRIYVDSRPEAYTAAFLADKYVAPAMDEAKWKALLWERQFNLICFSTASPWERAFIVRRAFDPDWAIVFVDGNVTILLRRSLENGGQLCRLEIPKDRFFSMVPAKPAR